MKMKKHKKNVKTLLNANESADYLGVSRQRFYAIRRKYEIPVEEKYGMKMFATLDLMRVRKLLDRWAGFNGN